MRHFKEKDIKSINFYNPKTKSLKNKEFYDAFIRNNTIQKDDELLIVSKNEKIKDSLFIDGKRALYNFINLKTGKFIGDIWFDSVMIGKEDEQNEELNLVKYAMLWIISTYDKEKKDFFCNILTRDGKLLCDRNYSYIDPFNDGMAIVSEKEKIGDIKDEKIKKQNFINLDGKLISEEWFDGAKNFKNGYGRVYKLIKHGNENGKKGSVYFGNFINKEGKLISDKWFEQTGDFNEEGFGYVMIDGVEKAITGKGTLCNNSFEAREKVKEEKL